MPTKLGKGGAGQEDFDPDTGEYTAGSSISKRGNKYWVHGDLRSREITKEEYDEFKAAGYKEDFDNDRKKLKFYKGSYGFSTEPTFYDREGINVDLDINEVMKLLQNEYLNQDKLKIELGELADSNDELTSSNKYQLGTSILREFNDEYQQILKDRENKQFEPRIQKANEFLNNIGKSEIKPVDVNSGANLHNYKMCNEKYATYTFESGWIGENYRDDWRIQHIIDSDKYDEYTSNCQRCVMAWYLRHLGYDVEAKAYDGKGIYEFDKDKNPSNYILKKAAPRIGYDFEGGTAYRANWSYSGFNVPKDTMFDYHGKDGEWQSTQYKRINEIVKNMPDDSVCFCSVKWRGARAAHVFIVHNNNGKVKFIDPQDDSDASRYFIGTDEYGRKYKIEASLTELLRINDFSFNGDTLPEIVRKRGE